MEDDVMARTSKPTDERVTPWWFIDQVEARYGPLEFDLCADGQNMRVRHCTPVQAPSRYFGIGSAVGQDALQQKWGMLRRKGHPCRCWLNMPYSEIPKWLAKAYSSVRRAPGLEIIALLPVGTSTTWFHRFIYHEALSQWRPRVADIWFPATRIDFEPHTTGARWPNMVVQFKVGT
jgi:hypothetical protein